MLVVKTGSNEVFPWQPKNPSSTEDLNESHSAFVMPELTSIVDSQASKEWLLVAASSISSIPSLSSLTSVRSTCTLIIWNLEAWLIKIIGSSSGERVRQPRYTHFVDGTRFIVKLPISTVDLDAFQKKYDLPPPRRMQKNINSRQIQIVL